MLRILHKQLDCQPVHMKSKIEQCIQLISNNKLYEELDRSSRKSVMQGKKKEKFHLVFKINNKQTEIMNYYKG